jgi:cytochrome b561
MFFGHFRFPASAVLQTCRKKDLREIFGEIHKILAIRITILVGLLVAAALKHHFLIVTGAFAHGTPRTHTAARMDPA